MNPTALPIYQPQIVPTLHRIQARYGYLNREELQQYSQQSGIPLYRLQAVASFFPHFRLEPAPDLTVRVCRDMACNLAGSAKILSEISQLAGENVHVEGVSCLGRCDRAPAACVSLHKAAEAVTEEEIAPGQKEQTTHDASDSDRYFLGHSADYLKKVIAAYQKKMVPKSEKDSDQPYSAQNWTVDPYTEGKPDYAAVQKAVAARSASITKATHILSGKPGWNRGKLEQFNNIVERRAPIDASLDRQIADAVRAWQTDDGWAAGPEIGGWSDPLLDEIDKSHANLRGMGGAGMPASQKWRDVRDAVRTARRRRTDDRAFIVVNGDESEPGTFKDRELLLRTPHLIVESVILAGLFTEATQGFIYIRHEYQEQIRACRQEIKRAESLGFCGPVASALGRPFNLSVFVSPGGYICGEQSALIEAISDRRAEPRNLPPKLETNGLDDRPTLVSNVETYAWVPYIILKGGKTYAELGANGWQGRRFFSISGDVKRPGVYEVPMGMTLRELICGDDYCQGMLGDKPLKALAPSGPSGGFIPAKLTTAAGLPERYLKNEVWQNIAKRRGFDPAATELDILDLELELDVFRALSPSQSLGAGMVVYAEGRDMLAQAVNSIQFFSNESCGKCVPCRIGSQKLAALGENLMKGNIDAKRWAEELLPLTNELGDVMMLTSICGLGRAVPWPLRTVVNYFPNDIARYTNAAKPARPSAPAEPVSAQPPAQPEVQEVV